MSRRLRPKGKCCKLIFVHDAVFPASGCFLKSSIEDPATSVRAKPKPGPTEIIRQRLPIYDKTYFIEAQKKLLPL